MKILHTVSICCCVLLCVLFGSSSPTVCATLQIVGWGWGVRRAVEMRWEEGRELGCKKVGWGKRESVYVRACVCVLEGEVRVHEGSRWGVLRKRVAVCSSMLQHVGRRGISHKRVAVWFSMLGDEESARITAPTSCSIGVRVLQYVGARLLRVLRVLYGDEE